MMTGRICYPKPLYPETEPICSTFHLDLRNILMETGTIWNFGLPVITIALI
jgi:hypothetical protein